MKNLRPTRFPPPCFHSKGQPLLYRRRPDGNAAPEPSHCLPSTEAERIPLVQGKRALLVFPKPALKHGSMMALLNAILLFDILNISSEICYLAGMRNPG